MPARVAIVYLAYNTKAYLEEVFASVRAQTYPTELLDFIVVDNHSIDGTPEWISQQTGCLYLPQSENTGYAEGNNIGMREAMALGADFIFLLNGDAKLHRDAISMAVQCAQADVTIASVQSRVMLWKTPEVVNVIGGKVHFLGFGFADGNGQTWESIQSQHQDGEEIAYASGCAVLYRVQALREVGLLDPYLFLYHEDLELGWRLRLAGWRNVLSTHSIAYHHYEFSRSIKKYYWMERNRWLVHLTHLSIKSLCVLVPYMLLIEGMLIVLALKGGWATNKILAWRNLLSPSSLGYIRDKRAQMKALRRCDDRHMIRYWCSEITHQETSNVFVTFIANPIMTLVWSVMKRFI